MHTYTWVIVSDVSMRVSECESDMFYFTWIFSFILTLTSLSLNYCLSAHSHFTLSLHSHFTLSHFSSLSHSFTHSLTLTPSLSENNASDIFTTTAAGTKEFCEGVLLGKLNKNVIEIKTNWEEGAERTKFLFNAAAWSNGNSWDKKFENNGLSGK